MSKLNEEKENATRMLALKSWVKDFPLKNKREPTAKEIFSFIQVLNEKTPPKDPEQLINLIEKEKKVREIARRIAHNEMIPPDHFIIHLKPNVNVTAIVSGGYPSVIELGILPGDPDFMTVLRRCIRRAEKVFKPSSLVPAGKKLEYDREIKKFKVWKGNEDYYPLISIDRLQVHAFEMLQIIDLETGEMVTRTRKVDQGTFKHYSNNTLVQEARLSISRKLYAEGKLKDEDFEYEPTTGFPII